MPPVILQVIVTDCINPQWIQGADQGDESPSWFYEGVDDVGLMLQPSGPSAGQSALMHAFDGNVFFLAV